MDTPVEHKRASLHISGLDSVRFVCALAVAAGHYHFQFSGLLSAVIGRRLSGLADSVFGVMANGSAAVAIFFVLSGFVIHLPYHRGKRFDLAEYYTRRYLRIVPPAVAFWIMWRSVDGPGYTWQDTILWSLICEGIYYAIYPLIRGINFKVAAFAMGILVLVLALTNVLVLKAADNHYTAFGWWTFVIGSPLWLGGCAVAEQVGKKPAIGRIRIWIWRGAIYALTVLMLVLVFHWVGYLGSSVITLTIFALPATMWIRREADYFLGRSAPSLDRLGSASYSLYLVHGLALFVLGEWSLLSGASYVALTIVGTMAFYFVIERPSHKVSRWLGRKVTRAPAPSGS